MLKEEIEILKELSHEQSDSILDFLDATGNLISMSLVTITVLFLFIPVRLLYYINKWRKANDREKTKCL